MNGSVSVKYNTVVMKKIFSIRDKWMQVILLVACVSFLSSARAQEAKTLFVNMPDSLSPLLTGVNRADCVDFLESNMKAQVDNRFGGKSEMTDLGKDYIRMQLSPQTSWQMKVLATSDTTQVICTVSTACAPVCDSAIRFYTTDWKELPAAPYLMLPVADDFFITPDSASLYDFQKARQQVDMLLVKADFNKSDNTLVFTLTTPEYIENETAEKLKTFLRRPLVYRWEGKFIPSGTLQ